MGSAAALVLSIFLLTFAAEDGATILAVSAATGGHLRADLAIAACFLGIWLGDLGIYGLARRFRIQVLRSRIGRRVISADRLDAGEQWFRRRGSLALVLCRVVPGTRLATFVAAGTLRMPVMTFAGVTAICAAVWVGGAFAVVQVPAIRQFFQTTPRSFVVAFTLGLLILPFLLRSLRRLVEAVRRSRIARWEFWPAWIFYAPVLAMCAWLAVRYRGISLPTVANPAQHNGGIVGESKSAILQSLMAAAPEFTAEAHLIASAHLPERIARMRSVLERHQIHPPFVLKPEYGQRGAGFRKIHSLEEAVEYLRQVPAPVVLQRYADLPHEAGIFYYRFPGETRGEILAITDKQFPAITGDSRRTIRELILADERARLMSTVYFERLREHLEVVLPAGEVVRLVEAGNHCQGCIFRDGAELYTEALREAFDRISQSLPGFFIGRYDVRYASPGELRAGRGFRIIELNGAASEATSIYDARTSLFSAYRMLYRQWQLVYAIGAANRRRGYAPASTLSLWHDWKVYCRMSAAYPIAD